jgi:protein-S-isoprenylcysteine O-methyltransferase Ste14
VRKITAGLFITLDGVVEAPEKWNPPYYDDELGQAVMPQFMDADLHLYGRRSHELFQAVFTGPAAPPHAELMTGTPKVVVSTTLEQPGWGPTTLISGNLVAELSRLQAAGGRERSGRRERQPAEPTSRLLTVGGPYRYVRNPLYLAWVMAITGQALLLSRPVLLIYAAAVFTIAAAFVRWYEEPTLAKRFGEQYEAYRKQVPGWWPRLPAGR